MGRRLHPILGGGNCFFRALSYTVYATEDFHTSVRAKLVQFAELNASHFSKYCTSSSINTHIQSMRRETIYATQMEAHVAASCLQRPVFIFTQKSGSGEYYWELFDPLPLKSLSSLPADSALEMHPFRHVELCHINRCHYDVVELLNGQHCQYPPPRLTSVTYVNLTE